MFDSRNHAAGVTVYGVPRAKITGLSMSQSKGMRVQPSPIGINPCWGDGVFGPKATCHPVKTSGGGLPPSFVVARGDTRSRNHRRRSPKMRPRNPIFQARIPSQAQYNHELGTGKLHGLRSLYLRIKRMGCRVDRGLDERYESARASFLRVHEERARELIAMERQLDATVR